MDFLIESQIKVYPTVGDFPATGAVKTLYIDESTSTTYYWTGSAYSEIRTEAKYEAIDVLNGTGSSQPKMTVCYLKTSSSSANTPEILLANANSEATSSKTIGLLLTTLANGATGKLITSGEFDKFDTSAYNVGDRLWLATTDGQMTTTVPSAPNHAVFIGIVTRKQSNNGRILVAIQNGYELQELHNVSITTPTDGQALIYEAASGLWKNITIPQGITIGTTPITSGTDGRVLFQNGGVVSQSAGITWDNTNKIFKVATGSEGIVIEGDASGYPTFKINTLRSGATRRNWMIATEQINAGDFVLYRSTTGGGVANTLVYSIFNDGNFGLNTSVNAGYKMDIAGTFRATVSTETNPFVIGHTNGNYATILIGNGSQLAAGQMGMYFNGTPMWSWNGSTFRLPGNLLSTSSNPSTLQLIGGWGGSTVGTSIRLASNTGNGGVFTATTGTQSTVEIGNAGNETWSPSSGNATYNLLNLVPRFNTSGTYSGISRGLYYAPTLTSITGLNHRAIETVTGDVLFGTTSGSLLVGTSINAGYKLDVNGTVRVADNNQLGWGNGNYLIANNATPKIDCYVQSSLILTIGQSLFTISVASRTRDISPNADNSFDIGGQFGRYRHGWFSGQLKVGDATAVNASAKVQIDSTNQGFLPPRMTTTQKNAIASPVAGLQVYDTTLNLMSYFNGTIWI